MSLRGHAQLVLRDLPSDKGQYDSTIVRSLEERFFSPNQTYIPCTAEETQRASESLSGLRQAIRTQQFSPTHQFS